jgi:hypothetical protein
VHYFVENCGFADVARKFAICQFADWHTSEIYGFAIAECAQEFAELRFADFKKRLLAHLCKSLLQGETYLLRFTEGTAMDN